MASRPTAPQAPATTAGLSLLELRRAILRRAGALSARARGLKKKGAGASAARLSDESERLLSLARTMGENNNTGE